jgi:hypothetical protein
MRHEKITATPGQTESKGARNNQDEKNNKEMQETRLSTPSG